MCGGGFTLLAGQGEDTQASFAAAAMPEPVNMANCIQHWTREKLLPGDIADACCSDLLPIHMMFWMWAKISANLCTEATTSCFKNKTEKRWWFKCISSYETDVRGVDLFGLRWRLRTLSNLLGFCCSWLMGTKIAASICVSFFIMYSKCEALVACRNWSFFAFSSFKLI